MSVDVNGFPYLRRRGIRSAPPLRQYSEQERRSRKIKTSRDLCIQSVQNMAKRPEQKYGIHFQRSTKQNPERFTSSTAVKVSQQPQINTNIEPQPHQLKRTLSGHVSSGFQRISKKEKGPGNVYYRPMTTQARNRSRAKKQSVCYSEGDECNGNDLAAGGTAIQAWDSFREHITMLNGIDLLSDSSKQSFDMKASDTHRKVIRDLKQKTLRRKTKSMILAAKLIRPNNSNNSKGNLSVHEEEEEPDETDSEAEEEREQTEKRKQAAQRHWAIIRREVNEKIRKRKENNTADKSWNLLRHQLRAATHARAVRMELYAKYGVVKMCSNVQPLDKPTISEAAQRLINTFQTLEVKNIKHLYFDTADERTIDT